MAARRVNFAGAGALPQAVSSTRRRKSFYGAGALRWSVLLTGFGSAAILRAGFGRAFRPAVARQDRAFDRLRRDRTAAQEQVVS
jgi:hypothetical protein